MSEPGTNRTHLHLRTADPEDVPLIRQLILELAVYEKLEGEMTASETQLTETLFGAQRYAEVIIAELDGTPAGFALFFHNYSTFLGKPGLYLEDLFVRPDFRRHGVGIALLARLARIARDRGCGRMEWAALDWNRLAIDFYLGLGARQMDEWSTFRLTGRQIDELAARGTD